MQANEQIALTYQDAERRMRELILKVMVPEFDNLSPTRQENAKIIIAFYQATIDEHDHLIRLASSNRKGGKKGKDGDDWHFPLYPLPVHPIDEY